ncbi:serine/threonine-protein kinase WNK4-like [Sander lucioperca]|uniref:serine/threonine-protein kinase WNK4-like n=1 Tax=Sander lucioperca TaxID=283035 RepID=UPI00125D1DED|nr:serine/threonine-protein kinase WNK4-like [Sander lucioperca]
MQSGLTPPCRTKFTSTAVKRPSSVSLSVKKPAVHNVGRFQVTASEDTPAVLDQEIRHINQAIPTTHSPPPSVSNQSESSESSTEKQSESESSVSTVTVSPPGQTHGYHDNSRGQEEEEDRKIRRDRRLSVGLWEGLASSFSQSRSRVAHYISSDESESDNKELWEELKELRERHQAEVQNLQANQKTEIEKLYLRKGNVPPPGIVSQAAMMNHRPRRPSKTGNYPPRKNSLQRLDMPPSRGFRELADPNTETAG